jgi:hypothetical protein
MAMRRTIVLVLGIATALVTGVASTAQAAGDSFTHTNIARDAIGEVHADGDISSTRSRPAASSRPRLSTVVGRGR